jgi:uncharacterized phage protein (TIGR01671 family)
MDRFKFRVWYKPYNDYVEKRDNLVLLSDGILCEYDGIEIDSDNYIIEQCTGLKDKNGNLIYEGDIIHDLGEIEPICSLPLIVRWDDRTAGFYLDHQKIGMRASLGRIDSADSHNYEIIGNVHEQPEQKDK